MMPLILLVDDNEDDRLLGSFVLTDLGYPCITAHNGQTAIDFCDRYLPTLVLLDIIMPEMDGLEVVRCLKQNPRTASIPIIALTCLAMHGDREQILAAGCDGYLKKPFPFEDLEEVIHQHFNDLSSAITIN